ncbi:MAG TPA: hypothetical protein O0Y17_01000 [Methanocorpusculum sp.]|nr:hypothetical protein [Methanocorpusculum sp.]
MSYIVYGTCILMPVSSNQYAKGIISRFAEAQYTKQEIPVYRHWK